MSLLEILPQPRRMVLGGTPYMVAPLRLKDLAAIESWLAGRSGSPLDVTLPQILATEPGPERDGLIRACWESEEQAEANRAMGCAEHQAALVTEAGATVFLGIVLRLNEGVDPGKVLGEISLREFESVERFAWADHPIDVLARLVDGPRTSHSRSARWPEIYCSLAERYSWLSPDAFGDLSLSQLVALRTGGEQVPGGLRGGEDLLTFARRRSAFFSPDPEADANGNN